MLPDGTDATAADIQTDADLWAKAYCRHVRGQCVQNNTHSCKKTCIKYAKENDPDLRRPQKSVCRFYFFMLVVIQMADAVKTILRKGKELVSKAYATHRNDRNQYGRIMVERRHPFAVSSSDLAQAATQCNVEVQVLDRAVPDGVALPTGASQREAAFESRVLFGLRNLSSVKAACLFAFKVGMRAAFICDFYMTKYHAKS